MTKWSLGYQLLRYYVKSAFHFFYQRLESNGKNNIPKKKPVIFAPNHQNALMDPLAIIFTNPKQTVFLTRADIFNNPLLLKVFTSLKMLPVYRIRDGAENLKNNERIFNKSVEVLEANASIALFAEATHTDKRRLRNLKKAVPRIAFMAEDKNDFKLDLQIVPVGIYYEDYVHSNTKLFVNYGKAFSIKEYKDLYNENPQKAYAEFKDQLAIRIKELIIHIEDLEHYNIYEQIRLLYRSSMKKRLGLKGPKLKYSFEADQKTIELAEKAFLTGENNIEVFGNQYRRAEQGLKKKGLNLNDFEPICVGKLVLSSLVLLIGFPIFLYGFINGILYYILSTRFIKKVKDKQFHSSFKFGIGAIAGPIIFLIHSLIFWAISGNGLWAIYYYFSLPIASILANKYRYLFNTTFVKWKVLLLKAFKSKEYKLIIKSRESLLSRLDELFLN
jgi:1-acyl-sn-glycerol-3-phosphate acyltransferase